MLTDSKPMSCVTVGGHNGKALRKPKAENGDEGDKPKKGC
jgi:hypothetical protein